MVRQDHPRPQFIRPLWTTLNGEWDFEFDDERIGDREKWYISGPFSKKITVPFTFQSSLSGIGDTDFHDVVWYRKQFKIPKAYDGKNIILHFGAVDYQAWVYMNGQLITYHEGGHTPFSVDITNVVEEENVLVVKVEDFSKDQKLPRGKQYWEKDSRSIFYTRTTGIWQTVWLEGVSQTYLSDIRMTPHIDTNEIEIRSFIKGMNPINRYSLKVSIYFKGDLVIEDIYSVKHSDETRKIVLNDVNAQGAERWWSPEHPNLYDVEITLYHEDNQIDFVKSYFGMRKISVENGKLCLNNRPYFMKMVLDQGYFPDGILTAPDDESIRRDVELTKAMGFNGARKHQKIEDPRYLYWCDQLGLLVWGEMANAYLYDDHLYVGRMVSEWQEVLNRDYNHPSIVAWVPLNESWGVPNIGQDLRQQHHALSLYHLTKSLDPTRLVISNDGWEHVKSDLCTIHDYEYRREVLTERYKDVESALSAMPANRPIYVKEFNYDNEPILVTEFGGISFKKSEWDGWGYSGASSDEDFVERLIAVVHPLLHAEPIQGYCYTQLTDVEQEINGLLTYDRKPKIPVEWIKQINEGKVPIVE